MRKLLFSIGKKDFDISYFSGTGAGGQHRNKHMNCVRLQHRESGALVTGQSNRDRIANTKESFRNLLKDKKFQSWHKIKVAETNGMLVDIETAVEKMMSPENLRVEKKVNGKWVEIQ